MLLLLVTLHGCAGQRAPKTRSQSETGFASWYGKPFHGRKTASGERYDMRELTAAHRTLAFDTVVEVKDLERGGKVRVRINDRGPFVDGRMLQTSGAVQNHVRSSLPVGPQPKSSGFSGSGTRPCPEFSHT